MEEFDVNTLETGDILLYHGTNYWFSYLIEWFTYSEFSHVSMVLKDPIYLDPKLEGLYILESGAENIPDAVEGKTHFGVQIVDLNEIIERYSGRIYVRKLKNNKQYIIEHKLPKINKRYIIEQKLPKIWPTIKDIPYDNHFWDMIKIFFGLNWGDSHRTDNFCFIALVTFLFEQFYFLTFPVEWDLIRPKDYDEDMKIDHILSDEIELESKIRIK